MFQGATRFNGTISAWDTGGVTTMSAMFHGASQFNSGIKVYYNEISDKNNKDEDDDTTTHL